jgi:hypothetical protein
MVRQRFFYSYLQRGENDFSGGDNAQSEPGKSDPWVVAQREGHHWTEVIEWDDFGFLPIVLFCHCIAGRQLGQHVI